MYGYFKLSISERSMARIMYALLITKSKLINCHHIGLQHYTRKQNSGHNVNVVVEVEHEQVSNFEELAKVKLQTSKEFQGEMRLNNIIKDMKYD